MVLILYMTPLSPPSRGVLMTAEALGLKLQTKEVNLMNKQQMSPEFQKINPQHTIPVLDDNGTVVWDSHAIITYLVGKYGQDDTLYPKDLAKRAQIDHRLHFDTGIAFNCIRLIIRGFIFGKLKTISQDNLAMVYECYGFLEKFIGDNQWLTGDTVTIADISLLATTSSLDSFIPIDADKFPKLKEWLARGEKLPFYGVNRPGLNDFKNALKMMMSQSQI